MSFVSCTTSHFHDFGLCSFLEESIEHDFNESHRQPNSDLAQLTEH